jgi:HPt (histidine-containing phosphotransfer) domain-containing protein
MPQKQQEPELETDIPQAVKDISELDYEEGLNYCGDPEDYLFALETYGESVAEKADQLDKCLKEKRYDDYALMMHSIKSMSKSIGAVGLSDMAKELEQAARSGDVKNQEDKAYSFIEKYRALGEKIAKVK